MNIGQIRGYICLALLLLAVGLLAQTKQNENLVCIGKQISCSLVEKGGAYYKDTNIVLKKGDTMKILVMYPNKYLLEYEVLKVLSGSPKDTIRFFYNDEFEDGPFFRTKTHFLFLIDSLEGPYGFHDNYCDVFKTNNNRWECTFMRRYRHLYAHQYMDKLKRVEFSSDAYIDVSFLGQGVVEQAYPPPYYSRQNDSVRPEYGIPVEEFIKVLGL